MIFIRHGQGEHTVNLPDSLHLTNPSLTLKGISQTEKLRTSLPLNAKDVLIVSPTLRTLQTASIWSAGIACQKIIHPLAGPRIFPARSNAATLPCDRLLDLDRLQSEFQNFTFAPDMSSCFWPEGINTLSEDGFSQLAEKFIGFCRSFECRKVYIVTHDGTITSYRQKILNQKLTREDFLGETEWIQLVVD
ncbi:histidine phosphatase family protein [Planococcus soli]|uniref:histidine phosphatase family protein n=1 Tax=Planococcus soli TaxID=2666072 RepID=UPI002E2C01A5|nr:histidine phosphatase family protein [Planococcus soli]